MLDKRFPRCPRPPLEVAPAEGLDQHLRLIQPRGVCRRQPGAPPARAALQVIGRGLGEVTQSFSLRANAIVKEPGSSYFMPRRCVSRLGLANGGSDSLESSPHVTLTRGAFSASSLVAPSR